MHLRHYLLGAAWAAPLVALSTGASLAAPLAKHCGPKDKYVIGFSQANYAEPYRQHVNNDLIALAKREIEQVGLGRAADVTDGCVIRQRKAYPVYDDAYSQHVAIVRQALERHCDNIHLVGRNGMHKYDNQDHAMMTAMLAAKNIIAGENRFDVWQVNQDAEYHESEFGAQSASGLRAVPERIK